MTGNKLKILALISMFIDHMGFLIYPQINILRVIGRLSFPIYAFFIFEGCRYTKNKVKHFTVICCLGILYSIVFSIVTGEIYGNIFITFSFSICIIYSIQYFKKYIATENKKMMILFFRLFLVIAAICVAWFACRRFKIDYGFWGIMLPVFPEMSGFNKHIEVNSNTYKSLILSSFFIGLVLLSISIGGIQTFGLLSLIPLLMYNFKRGKYKMKKLFYLFYPLHFIFLEMLTFLV